MSAFGVRVTPARARVSGAMMMRFGSSSAPTVSGVKRSGMVGRYQEMAAAVASASSWSTMTFFPTAPAIW